MLRWYYSVDATTVLEITDRVRWPEIEVGGKANQDGWTGDLLVDDPAGDFIPLMFRRIYAIQDAAPAGDQNVGNWFITNLKVKRLPARVESQRQWVITMADENSLIDRRKFVGSDANRPAETDIAEIRWFLTTTEGNVLSPDETYIDTSAPVNLDATDLRTDSPRDMFDRCVSASQKQYWVKYEEAAVVGGTIVSSSVAAASVITTTTAHGLYTGMTVVIAGHSGSTPDINGSHVISVTGTATFTIPVNVTVGGTGGTVSTVGRYVIWYANQNTSDLYLSTVGLSNVVSEVGDPTDTLIYALSGDAELDRAGGRMASGLIEQYKNNWIYLQDTDVGDAYAYVDQVTTAKHVSSLAAATAEVTAKLRELALPDDEITTTMTVDEANLNLVRHGMRVLLHATHFPNYTDSTIWPGYAAAPTPCRVMERTVRQVGAKTFELVLKLSPMKVQCPDATPGQTFARLSATATHSGDWIVSTVGNVFYLKPGVVGPEVPTPGYLSRWYFPVYDSGGVDYAGDCVANSLRVLVVGDGSLSIPTTLGTGSAGRNLHAYVRHRATSGIVDDEIRIIAAGTTEVFTIDTESQAHCVNWVDIIDDITGQSCGHKAFGFAGGAVWTPA